MINSLQSKSDINENWTQNWHKISNTESALLTQFYDNFLGGYLSMSVLISSQYTDVSLIQNLAIRKMCLFNTDTPGNTRLAALKSFVKSVACQI